MNSISETSNRPSTAFADRLNAFFFAREVPFGMTLVRMTLPLVLLVDVVRRWPFVREIYSADGAPAPLAANFGYPDWLPVFPGSLAVALHTSLAIFMVMAAIGWCTRFSLLATTVLYFYFCMLDCLSTGSKYTVIATHLLLLLSLSNCGELWSVDAWIKRRARKNSFSVPGPDLRAPIWPQRLAQLLFGMIYFGAAVTKLHMPEFFTGDQLIYWMMTYINNEHPLGDYMSQYPLFVSISCFITFLWELVFVFTVFRGSMRWYVLGLGTIFHVMTVFTLGLIVFPIVIIASYLVFLSEGDARAILNWKPLRDLSRRFVPPVRTGDFEEPKVDWRSRLAPTGAFALTATLICLVAVEAEFRMDPYRVRGAGGPLPLRELTDAEAERLFSTEVPMRQCDKLLAFDLGTTLVGEHLALHRKEFRQGEKLVAQFTLAPPHGDMWVDCVLCQATVDPADPEERLVPGKIVSKVGQPVYRETFRGNFFFMLDETLEPGDYFLKLRSSHEDVSRKRFQLLPRVDAAAAN
jgi:hypothetical protein